MATTQRVLVTGHLGYIGTVLTPLLLERGYDVVGLDTDLFARSTLMPFTEVVPNLGVDVRNVSIEALEGFDSIIHLAGLSNDPLGDLVPANTHEINYEATVRLARMAKDVGVDRFLFSSSCSNYAGGDGQLQDENTPMNPVTPYAVSKAQSEVDLAALASPDFSPIYLRNATAFGVSPRIRFDLVVNNLTAWAVTTGQVRLKSDGTVWRPLVHIEDIATAFIALMEAPREVVHNEAFNVVGDEQNFLVRDIAEMVHEIVPDCEVSFAETAARDFRNYRVSNEKIRTTVDHKPTWTASAGIAEVYGAIADLGLSPDDFEGERFSRVAHLKAAIEANRVDHSFRPVAKVTS